MKESKLYKLPVSVSGHEPWNIQLEFSIDDITWTALEEQRLNAKSAMELTVERHGHYRLVSVRDAFCVGKMVGLNRVFISIIKKPSASIATTYETAAITPICQFSKAVIDIILEGTPPFSVLYQHRGVNGVIETRHSNSNVLNLKTNDVGMHWVSLISVSDANYWNVSANSVTAYQYQVLPLPRITFPRSAAFQVCSTYSTLASLAMQIFPRNFLF